MPPVRKGRWLLIGKTKHGFPALPREESEEIPDRSGIHTKKREVRRAGFIDTIGRENFLPTFDEALERASALVNPAP